MDGRRAAIADFAVNSLFLNALAQDTLARKGRQHKAARSVARYLIGDGSALSGYDFNHPRFRELYLEDVLGESERVGFRARFRAWGSTMFKQSEKDLPDYVRHFWITHLTDAGEWDHTQACFALRGRTLFTASQ